MLNIYLQASLAIIFRKPGNSSVGKKKKSLFGKTQVRPYLLIFLYLLMAVALLCLWKTVQFWSHRFPLSSAQRAF